MIHTSVFPSPAIINFREGQRTLSTKLRPSLIVKESVRRVGASWLAEDENQFALVNGGDDDAVESPFRDGKL